jgi:pyruvate,water dikinase
MAPAQSPLLKNLKKILCSAFGVSRDASGQDQAKFRLKYANFQELLESNAELLRVISSLEEKLPGREIFGMAFLQSAASQGVFHALRMVRGFENLSGRQQPALRQTIEIVRKDVKQILAASEAQAGPWFLGLDEVSAADAESVGGKCANLGELRNRVHLPVPDGFIVSTAAFRAFLDNSDLRVEISKLAMSLNPGEPASIQAASEEIQRLMLLAPFPAGFEEELHARHEALAGRLGVTPAELKTSMRSSAVGEDGELSFAGQYLSVLGVTRAKLAESYRYVAASLYTPRAIAYRLLKGVPDEAASMAVACLAMVKAKASGVMYTRHPFDPCDENILINAVWGLGPYAVDGVVTPDRYVVDKCSRSISSTDVAGQPVQLTCREGGGVEQRAVDPTLLGRACLTPEQILTLAGWGAKLEKHYGKSQDVEWALDESDSLILLQARPLAGLPEQSGRCAAEPPIAGQAILLEGGETACPGTGCGEARLVRDDDDLAAFPDGAVLVAEHSSPKFMVAMNKACAIVTDHGSVTGHMASLTREFGVPTILGLDPATRTLRDGVTITVDARNRRVYLGRVEELLEKREEPPAPMLGSTVHRMLQELFALVGPLHLLDPKSPQFSPEHCSTLHDITRYLHEKSYAVMFTLGDQAAGEGGMAVRLDAGVGLDLHVIDLGGGLNVQAADKDVILPVDVESRPFKAVLEGLADKDFVASGPRPVHLQGFLSVMGRQMLEGPSAGGERFGEKSYAIISDKYLNFSSRVGYHYGVLDSYCGKTINKNYITFAFKGGAAGEDRRERRARAIAIILERLGFSVSVNADRVEGRFQKYTAELIENKLVQLGRLLQFTRQTDMLMTCDNAVTALAESFLRGDKVFGMGESCPLP